MPRPTERMTTRLRSGAFARLRHAKRSRAISLIYAKARPWSPTFDKKRHRHPETDGNYDPPNRRPPKLARRTRATPSAQDRRHRHNQDEGPLHHPGPDKI